MLFYLTDSLIVEENNPLFKGIYKAVHNLATQVVDGNHLLTASYAAIKHFRNIFRADPIIGLFFNDLFQNFATIGIPADLKFYIEIVKEQPTCRNEDGREICQKLYSYYLRIDVSNKTYLIGEDLNDTLFYKHILNWFISQLHANYSYAFHELGGGGKNTFRAINNELESNHIVISIIDTDQKYVGCPPEKDGTYDKCIHSVHSTAYEYKLLPLEVHEIENLVPLNYIDSFDIWTHGKPNDTRKKRAFDFLRNNAEEILPYFDYKKGIKYDDMFRQTSDYRDLAKKCYIVNEDMVKKEPTFEGFIAGLKDKGEIYPNLIGGSGTLTHTIELIKSESCPQPILLEYQKHNWTLIGQNLLDWGIARKAEAIS